MGGNCPGILIILLTLKRKKGIRFNDAFIFIKRKQMRNTELYNDEEKLASSGTYLE